MQHDLLVQATRRVRQRALGQPGGAPGLGQRPGMGWGGSPQSRQQPQNVSLQAEGNYSPLRRAKEPWAWRASEGQDRRREERPQAGPDPLDCQQARPLSLRQDRHGTCWLHSVLERKAFFLWGGGGTARMEWGRLVGGSVPAALGAPHPVAKP